MNVSNLAFYIGKTQNRNLVIYTFNIINDIINPEKPLINYWLMREDNNRTEELNYIEDSRAFGYKVIESPVGSTDIHFKIVSIDDIFLIRKAQNSNKYNVIIILDIDNSTREYILKKVFLHLSGMMDQNVDSIDFICEAPETGKLFTHERIINS